MTNTNYVPPYIVLYQLFIPITYVVSLQQVVFIHLKI